MADALIRNKSYEKQEGTACFAPYVDVTISALTGRKSLDISFKARIDTGADITCIPSNQAKLLMPLLLGRPVLIRGHDGKVKRSRTHLVILSIHGHSDKEQVSSKEKTQSYRPERGVLLTDSDIGLIGMDVISKYWKVTFDGDSQKFSVECI